MRFHHARAFQFYTTFQDQGFVWWDTENGQEMVRLPGDEAASDDEAAYTALVERTYRAILRRATDHSYEMVAAYVSADDVPSLCFRKPAGEP